MLGIVRYQGPSGTLYVSTVRPDGLAMSKGLYLGNPAGALPSGTPTFAFQGIGDNTAVTMLRWYDNGLVIDLVSADLSLDQLQAIAGNVALK